MPRSPKPRILVVDDDYTLREAIRQLLDPAEFEIVEARDARDAVRTFRIRLPDLVLCDLLMPGKDGLELIGELRRDFPSVKVIAMSGGGAEGTFDLLPLALQTGAKGVLYKPFDRGLVLAAINRVLGSPF